MRWRPIKSAFSHVLPKGEHVSASRAGKGERGIWERRYWEHTIRDETDFARHVDYIHFNPVKHDLVTRVADGRTRPSIALCGGAFCLPTGAAACGRRTADLESEALVACRMS